MAIVKDSGSPKKITISLQPLSQKSTPTESVYGAQSEPHLIHTEGLDVDGNKKRTIGMLKSMKLPEPQVQVIEAPLEIPNATMQAIAKYETDLRRTADSKIAAFKSEQMAAIQAQLDQYKTQQLSTVHSEMGALRDQGYKDGFEQGQSKGLAEYSDQLRELAGVINDVTQNKRLFLENSEPELLKLAIKIAEKIVQNQVQLDQNALIAIVDQAIRRITDKDKVIIKTCPEDADFVRQHREEILEKMPDIRTLEVHEDPRVEQGGCIIETRLGFIDSSISTKLASVEAALFKVYNDR